EMMAVRTEPESDLLPRLQITGTKYPVEGINGLDGIIAGHTGGEEEVDESVPLVDFDHLEKRSWRLGCCHTRYGERRHYGKGPPYGCNGRRLRGRNGGRRKMGGRLRVRALRRREGGEKLRRGGGNWARAGGEKKGGATSRRIDRPL